MKIFLRPTGCSILVGLIDVSPGDIGEYADAVIKPLRRWRQHHERRQQDDRKITTAANPEDFYKACGFFGIGNWNFITMTLVSEQGLAAHLGFLGHPHGQMYFHAHDSSIYLEPSESSKEKVVIDRLLTVARDLGISDVVHLPIDSLKKRKNQPAHEAYAYKEPSGRRRYKSIVYRGTHRSLGELRPIGLSHIYSGNKSLYGLFDNEKYKPEKKKPNSFLRTTHPDELLTIYQLKINQFFGLENYSKVHTLAYMAILFILHERLADMRESGTPAEHLPSFIRPLFTDGYFDMVVLMRGYRITLMDELMQHIKFISSKQVCAILGRKGLKHLWKGLGLTGDEEVPLFTLAHSTVAVPYSKVKNVEDKHRKALDRLADFDSRKHKIPTRLYDRLIKDLACYGGPEEKKFKLRASTQMSIKSCRMAESLEDQRIFREMIGAKVADNSQFLYGRHDFDVYPPNEMISFAEFLARLTISVTFFLRRGYPKNMKSRSIFHRRLNSPVLSIISRPKMKFKLDQHWAHHEEIYPDFRQKTFSVLSVENIQRILDRLNTIRQDYPDSPELDAYDASWQFWHNYLAEHFETASECDPHDILDMFEEFLQLRFGTEVSPETQESLIYAISMIDSCLAEPLLFNLYLDVFNRVSRLLEILFTLSQTEMETSRFRLDSSDFEIDTQPDFEIHTQLHLNYYDPEARLIKKWTRDDSNYIGLEAFFIGQVDLFQQVLDQRQSGSFPNYDRSISRMSDLRMLHAKKMAGICWMINNILQTVGRSISIAVGGEDFTRAAGMTHFFLPVFSNSPEVLCNYHNQSISINARLLTSIEGITNIVHELGHVMIHNISSRGLSRDGDTRYIWREVACDLTIFKLCYAPLKGAFYSGKFNDEYRIYDMPRVSSFPGEEEYDLYDDFLLAWMFHLILHPKIKRRQSFRILLLRLALILAVLKVNNYPEHYSREETESCVRRVFETCIAPFIRVKYSRMFMKITNTGPHEKLLNLKDSFWLDLFEHADDFLTGGFYANFALAFAGYLNSPTEDPFRKVLEYLGAADSHEISPYFKPVIMMDPVDLFSLGSGILPKDFTDPESSFAAALQLAGVINLGFVQQFNSAKLLFSEGYPGFENHRDQQALAKMRRLINDCLLQGEMNQIRRYLKTINRSFGVTRKSQSQPGVPRPEQVDRDLIHRALDGETTDDDQLAVALLHLFGGEKIKILGKEKSFISGTAQLTHADYRSGRAVFLIRRGETKQIDNLWVGNQESGPVSLVLVLDISGYLDPPVEEEIKSYFCWISRLELRRMADADSRQVLDLLAMKLKASDEQRLSPYVNVIDTTVIRQALDAEHVSPDLLMKTIGLRLGLGETERILEDVHGRDFFQVELPMMPLNFTGYDRSIICYLHIHEEDDSLNERTAQTIRAWERERGKSVPFVLVINLRKDDCKLETRKKQVFLSRGDVYELTSEQYVDSEKRSHWFTRTVFMRLDFNAQYIPYGTKGPVFDKRFFGRGDELERLTKQGKRRGGLIIGPHQSGKTSFLFRLAKKLHADEKKIINLTSGSIHHFFMETMRALPESPEDSEITLDLWTIAIRSQEKPVTFLIDEIDDLLVTDSKSHFEITSRMRSLQQNGFCRFFLSGKEHLFKFSRTKGNPLVNFGEMVALYGLEEHAALNLITQPTRELGFSIKGAQAKRIFEGTSGVPILIQEFCIRLLQYKRTTGSSLIEDRDIKQIEDDPLYLQKVFHFFKQSKIYPEAQHLLILVGQSLRTGLTRQEINTSIAEAYPDILLENLDETLSYLIFTGVLIEFEVGHYRLGLPYLIKKFEKDPSLGMRERA